MTTAVFVHGTYHMVLPNCRSTQWSDLSKDLRSCFGPELHTAKTAKLYRSVVCG